MNKIPKIIHIMWIGLKPAPLNLMLTWKNKNPDFEYIFWDEEEIKKRDLVFKCIKQINDIPEMCGKCDILRWEILYKYGGIFVDADSICIEPLDDYFMTKTAFSTYENEIVRKSLVATGIMGFIPNHPLCRDIIDWIADPKMSEVLIRESRAWVSVGPVRLTTFIETGNYPDFSIFPSYCILPIHHTGLIYEGHRKVYAHQVWGSSNGSYDTMNDVTLPKIFENPLLYFSILVSSYNTKREFLKNCLDSIKDQNGYFGIELVWVNDGSNEEYTDILESELYEFGKMSRFTKIKYIRTLTNKGTFEALNKGIIACSNEYIFKMDSDDVMVPNRLKIQYDFMMKHPDAVVCGGAMRMFNEDGPIKDIYHQEKFSWNEFTEKPVGWFMSHPTLCYKKSAILSVGNYNTDYFGQTYAEDFDLELRLMKQYGFVYNIQEILLYYRVHEEQLTNTTKYKEQTEERNTLINRIFLDATTKNIEIDL